MKIQNVQLLFTSNKKTTYINLLKHSPAVFESILPSFNLYRYTCDKRMIKAEYYYNLKLTDFHVLLYFIKTLVLDLLVDFYEKMYQVTAAHPKMVSSQKTSKPFSLLLVY